MAHYLTHRGPDFFSPSQSKIHAWRNNSKVTRIKVKKRGQMKTTNSTIWTSFTWATQSLPSVTSPGTTCTSVSILMLNTHIKYSANYNESSCKKEKRKRKTCNAMVPGRVSITEQTNFQRAKERHQGCRVPPGVEGRNSNTNLPFRTVTFSDDLCYLDFFTWSGIKKQLICGQNAWK